MYFLKPIGSVSLARNAAALVLLIGLGVLFGRVIKDTYQIAPADQTAGYGNTSSPTKEGQLDSIFTPIATQVIAVPSATRPGSGGGLTSIDELLLLMNHAGQIFVVSPTKEVIPTAIEAPENGFQAYVEASKMPPYDGYTHAFQWFRYNDIAYIGNAAGPALVVSYTKYHPDKACYTNTVSLLLLDQPVGLIDKTVAKKEQWKDLFQSAPCLPLKKEWRAIEGHMAGGRIAFDGRSTIYLASGDYGWDGIYGPLSPKPTTTAIAQDPDTDYGRVIGIDINTGASTRISRGQRNTQGIEIDQAGQVWTVEHGPRGGDELNRIVAGQNYGWPLAIYGTQYSGVPVPGTEPVGRHDTFTRPTFAWLPSVAPSGLTRIAGFHSAWNGDLLMSTFKNGLIRIRIADERVVFAERIAINYRIRYVHQHSTGEIVLWTDNGELIFLSPAPLSLGFDAANAFVEQQSLWPDTKKQKVKVALGQCAECHSFDQDNNVSAPSLANLIGSETGTTTFPGYSRALLANSGIWSRESLTNFLTNPGEAIPGTYMPDPGLNDSDVTSAIVEVLAEYAQ